MAQKKVIAVCRRHWTAYWFRGLIVVLLICYMPSCVKWGNWGDLIISLIAAALIVVCIIFSFKNDYIMLTDTKIIGHMGVIRSKTLSCPVSKIQNVGYSNGLFGKILGYHTLIIDNAGSGKSEFVFKHAADAVNFANEVEQATGK